MGYTREEVVRVMALECYNKNLICSVSFYFLQMAENIRMKGFCRRKKIFIQKKKK